MKTGANGWSNKSYNATDNVLPWVE